MEATPLLLNEAKKRNWRLVHLWHWRGHLPARLHPEGALVHYLPDSQPVVDLLKYGCACVRFGTLPHPDDDKLLAVLPDFKAEGTLAAEHFSARGFQHVGFWGTKPWGNFQAMFDGFKQRADQLGMAVHLYRFSPKRDEPKQAKVDRRREEVAKWLLDVPKPVGLFASGDWQAAEYCIDISEAGLRVPDDVAVLSRGNMPHICESCFPTLSSLDLDEAGRLRVACDWIQRLMDGETAPDKPIMFQPRGFIERESTNIIGASDRVVSEAVRYMWEHLHLDLSVEQVAAQVGLSESQLQRRFRKALGRSIVQELLRKRLDEAKRLLRVTDLAVSDIAPRLGFHSATYLHSTFRRSFGLTPLDYRNSR